MLQGGDFTHASGIGGESIYGDKFAVRPARSHANVLVVAHRIREAAAPRTSQTPWTSVCADRLEMYMSLTLQAAVDSHYKEQSATAQLG